MLSKPWVEYFQKVSLLFSRDHEILVYYMENENELYILTENIQKMVSLNYLFPKEKMFGDVCLKIIIKSKLTTTSEEDYVLNLLKGNKAFKHMTYDDDKVNIILSKEPFEYYENGKEVTVTPLELASEILEINKNKITLKQE